MCPSQREYVGSRRWEARKGEKIRSALTDLGLGDIRGAKKKWEGAGGHDASTKGATPHPPIDIRGSHVALHPRERLNLAWSQRMGGGGEGRAKTGLQREAKVSRDLIINMSPIPANLVTNYGPSYIKLDSCRYIKAYSPGRGGSCPLIRLSDMNPLSIAAVIEIRLQ